MKKIILFAVVLSLFSLTYSQKKQQYDVDLKKLFREKVNEIKKKNGQNVNSKKTIINSLSQNAKVVKKTASVQNSPIFNSNKKVAKKSRSTKKAYNSILLKGFILFEATLLAAIVVVYRRKKVGFKKALKRELKENIGLLREEKIETTTNRNLENVRKSLTRKKINIKQGSHAITHLAKKFSIAKGEVHLAIKLNVIAGK